MKYLNQKLQFFFQILFINTLLVNCNGQTNNVDICKKHYKNAQKSLNAFYSEDKQIFLKEALIEVEMSMNCKEIRAKSIDMKISILSLQKEYEKACLFIESLDEKDFSKKYKKSMQYNFFKALNYESKYDTINRNIYLDKAINDINNFIKVQNIIDQESYYDLIFIKSRKLTKMQLDAEIGLLVEKYPAEKVFFEILKESFNEDDKQVKPILD